MSPKTPRAPQPTFRPPGPFQKPPSYAAFKPTPPQREPLRCYTCNKVGQISRDCRSMSTAAMEFQGYYESPSQQDYFQQQNYPQYSEYDDLEEPHLEVAAATTFRPPRSSYGTPPPSGPAKTTTPPVSKPRSPRHLLILAHLLQPTRLFPIPVGSTMLLDAKGVFSLPHQHTTAKHSLPYAKTVDSSIQSL